MITIERESLLTVLREGDGTLGEESRSVRLSAKDGELLIETPLPGGMLSQRIGGVGGTRKLEPAAVCRKRLIKVLEAIVSEAVQISRWPGGFLAVEAWGGGLKPSKIRSLIHIDDMSWFRLQGNVPPDDLQRGNEIMSGDIVDLMIALDAALPSASFSERFSIQSLLIDPHVGEGDHGAMVIATDGHRLARVPLRCQWHWDPHPIALGSSELYSLAAVTRDHPFEPPRLSNAGLQFPEGRFSLVDRGKWWTLRLCGFVGIEVTGSFHLDPWPDYGKVIDSVTKIGALEGVIRLDRWDDLIEVLSVAQAMKVKTLEISCRGAGGPLYLEGYTGTDDKVAVLHAEVATLDSGLRIPEEDPILISPDYLMDAITSLGDVELEICVGAHGEPVVVRAPERDAMVIVMPLRVRRAEEET